MWRAVICSGVHSSTPPSSTPPSSSSPHQKSPRPLPVAWTMQSCDHSPRRLHCFLFALSMNWRYWPACHVLWWNLSTALLALLVRRMQLPWLAFQPPMQPSPEILCILALPISRAVCIAILKLWDSVAGAGPVRSSQNLQNNLLVKREEFIWSPAVGRGLRLDPSFSTWERNSTCQLWCANSLVGAFLRWSSLWCVMGRVVNLWRKHISSPNRSDFLDFGFV